MTALLTVTKKELLKEVLVEKFRHNVNAYYYHFKNDDGTVIEFRKNALSNVLIMRSKDYPDNGEVTLNNNVHNKVDFVEAVYNFLNQTN